MPDITIPDAAVEATAVLIYETRTYRLWADAPDDIKASWRGDALEILAAAAPYIAARALKDMGEWFDRAAQLGTGERDVIAAQACYDRADLIEADHG